MLSIGPKLNQLLPVCQEVGDPLTHKKSFISTCPVCKAQVTHTFCYEIINNIYFDYI